MQSLKIDYSLKPLVYMVPGAGIEPARYFYRGILSPLRLPISPPRAQGRIVQSLEPLENAFPQGAGNQLQGAFRTDITLIKEGIEFDNFHRSHVTGISTIFQ